MMEYWKNRVVNWKKCSRRPNLAKNNLAPAGFTDEQGLSEILQLSLES
jgi:hypothetical protein